MSERIAGKTFSTLEEIGAAPIPAEEIAEALRKIDEGRLIRDSIPVEQRKFDMGSSCGAHTFPRACRW